MTSHNHDMSALTHIGTVLVGSTNPIQLFEGTDPSAVAALHVRPLIVYDGYEQAGDHPLVILATPHTLTSEHNNLHGSNTSFVEPEYRSLIYDALRDQSGVDHALFRHLHSLKAYDLSSEWHAGMHAGLRQGVADAITEAVSHSTMGSFSHRYHTTNEVRAFLPTCFKLSNSKYGTTCYYHPYCTLQATHEADTAMTLKFGQYSACLDSASSMSAEAMRKARWDWTQLEWKISRIVPRSRHESAPGRGLFAADTSQTNSVPPVHDLLVKERERTREAIDMCLEDELYRGVWSCEEITLPVPQVGVSTTGGYGSYVV